jgi:hypothetical protein
MGDRRSSHVRLRHVLVASAVAAGAWGCALVAGVDFDSARFDPLTEVDAGGTFFDEAGRIAPGERLPDGAVGCAADRKSCNGGCAPKDDIAYGCGAEDCNPCSLPHTTGSTCGQGGSCIPQGCEVGYDNCDRDPSNGCEADLGRRETCGACGTACDAGMLCAPGGCVADCPGTLVPCNGACVDTQTSVANCGGCGTVCPGAANADPACNGGQCRIACRTGFADCANNPAQACAPLPKWFVDGDNDGFGTAAFVTNCVKPAGHAAASGDCLDSNGAVHPGAAAAAQPFGGPAGPSFDYDCSGAEEEIDNPVHWPGSCGGGCNATGFDPLPARAGAGVNNYCGSPMRHICFFFRSCANTTYDGGVFINCK